MWRRVGRRGGGTNAAPHIYPVLFSLHKLPKTATITTLLLFGHVTLLCGTFLFILLSDEPMQLSHCLINTPSILPLEAYQCQSEISPFIASETFTQRRRRRIGTRSLHPNSSAIGASSDNMYMKIFCNNTSFGYFSSLIQVIADNFFFHNINETHSKFIKTQLGINRCSNVRRIFSFMRCKIVCGRISWKTVWWKILEAFMLTAKIKIFWTTCLFDIG